MKWATEWEKLESQNSTIVGNMKLPCLYFSVAKSIILAALPYLFKAVVSFSSVVQKLEVTVFIHSSQPVHFWPFLSKWQLAWFMKVINSPLGTQSPGRKSDGSLHSVLPLDLRSTTVFSCTVGFSMHTQGCGVICQKTLSDGDFTGFSSECSFFFFFLEKHSILILACGCLTERNGQFPSNISTACPPNPAVGYRCGWE